MRVYVIRHGESETNQSKKWTGWLDVHLTEKGREDAQKAGAFLAGVVWDRIYTSDLVRARETAEIAIPGCQYETSELLREINVGNIANKPLSVLTAAQKNRAAQIGYTDFDGESKEQFYKRISGFLKRLEGFSCENIALFSHAGWLRGALDTVLGVELPRGRVCCNNCTVAIFEYLDGKWQLHSWINLS